MKAIVLHQPYATLAALGIKQWETRPVPPTGTMRPDQVPPVRGLPGCSINRGERIAIVAGQKPPTEGAKVGGWSMGRRASAWIMSQAGTHDPWIMSQAGTHGPLACAGCPHFHPLPLGAVVATAVVTEALPVVAESKCAGFPAPPGGMVTVSGPFCPVPSLTRFQWGRNAWSLAPTLYCSRPGMTDQLPFGDWRHGRWAWRLTDVEPCVPIPCKGAQGVFRLPDDVAAELAGVTR